MFKQVRLDHAGMASLLKSTDVAEAVSAAADAVRDALPPMGTRTGAARFDVTHGVTDRAKSWVTIMHPVAMGLEARNGYLVRAAATVGLDYRGWSTG